MNYVAHQFVAGVPRAAAVWSALVVLAVATMLTVANPPWRERALRRWVRITASRIRRARRHREIEQARRRAQDLATAAAGAGAEAARRREQWWAACRAVDAAWRAFDAADRAARDALSATAYAVSPSKVDPGEVDDRRRTLHRTASEAHRRGDLADWQLADALAGRNGWDPGRDPAVLAARLRCAIRDHRWQRLLISQAREREAWEAVDAASAARVALAREAARAHRGPRPVQTSPAPAPASASASASATSLGWLSHPAAG